MRKLTLLLTAILFALQLHSQTTINYQFVARDATGNPLVAKNIAVKSSILENSANGKTICEENFNLTTVENGIAIIVLGDVNQTDFAKLMWETKQYYIKIEIDLLDEKGYFNNGMPHKLTNAKALSTVGSGVPLGTTDGDMLYWKDNKWNLVQAGLPEQKLEYSVDNSPVWGGKALAALTTTPIDPTSVSYKAATCGGAITFDGYDEITERGICYNTSQNPTIENQKIVFDGNDDNFVIPLTNLISETKYYVRAYAINSVGVRYGVEQNFTTLPKDFPTIVTEKTRSITSTTALCNATITNVGVAAVIASGVYIGTNPDPSQSGTKLTFSGTGNEIFITASVLSPTTTYYVQGFATNINGEALSENIESFTTPSTPDASLLLDLDLTEDNYNPLTKQFVNKGSAILTASSLNDATFVTAPEIGREYMFFNGINDYLDLGSTSEINRISDEITISAWVKPQTVRWGTNVDYKPIVCIGRGYDVYRKFSLNIHYRGNIYSYCTLDNGSIRQTATTTPLIANSNYYISLSYNKINSVSSVYVNGILKVVSKVEGVNTNLTNSSYRLGIGKALKTSGIFDNGSYFHGSMGSVKIWNRALSAEEINAIYLNESGQTND